MQFLNGFLFVVAFFCTQASSCQRHGAKPVPLSLISAVKKGDLKKVEKCLASDNVDATDAEGSTALHWACDRVRELDSHTSLVERQLEAYFKIVDQLIKAGADINAQTYYGYTPLYLACLREQSGDSGDDVIRLVTQLIDAGANVNAKTTNGRTPLYEAVRNYDNTMVERLLQEKEKINLNIRDANGCTPLYKAVRMCDHIMVERLLKAGADSNITTNNGCTPLHLACSKNEKGDSGDDVIRLVTQLIDAGADVNVKAKDGFSPLHLAVRNRDNTMVEKLLKAQARPNITDNDGWSPLHVAVFVCDNTMVEKLLKAKANPNITNTRNGCIPLHLACSKNEADDSSDAVIAIVTQLLQEDAEVNVKDINGYTPLDCAKYAKNDAVIQLLVAKGAN